MTAKRSCGREFPASGNLREKELAVTDSGLPNTKYHHLHPGSAANQPRLKPGPEYRISCIIYNKICKSTILIFQYFRHRARFAKKYGIKSFQLRDILT
jgi:hypothetical protein